MVRALIYIYMYIAWWGSIQESPFKLLRPLYHAVLLPDFWKCWSLPPTFRDSQKPLISFLEKSKMNRLAVASVSCMLRSLHWDIEVSVRV